MKTYCTLGFGNNFFYPLGENALSIPSELLLDPTTTTTTMGGIGNNEYDGGSDKKKEVLMAELTETTGSETEETREEEEEDEDNIIEEDNNDNHDTNQQQLKHPGTEVCLLPINIHAVDGVGKDDSLIDEEAAYYVSSVSNSGSSSNNARNNNDIIKSKNSKKKLVPISKSAKGWMKRRREGDFNKYFITSSSTTTTTTNANNNNDDNDRVILPTISCGATHTSVIFPRPPIVGGELESKGGGDVYVVGTIFGKTHKSFIPMPIRLPLKIIQLSSGRRHVLALTESPTGGGGGGVMGGMVLSWGAGHFGQLGHGPDVTSQIEPRVIERLMPNIVGGAVIEIAAGGLHSAAIVALSNTSMTTNTTTTTASTASTTTNNNNVSNGNVVVRETRTFAWGSNRKGQCGVEGGKCATVPEPLPIISIKRDAPPGSIDNNIASNNCNPKDLVVHFEKLSLGRLHTVALTAYGEVYTWGSTSMGRCGHNNGSSLDPPSSATGSRGGDRRFVQQPRHISALRNVVVESIAAGGAHTLALSKGGRVFAWGAGGDGQCGQGHAGNLFSPRPVRGFAIESMASTKKLSTSQASLSSCTVAAASPSESKFEKVVAVRASGCYSAAITASGDVYTWGFGGGAAIGHPIPSEGSVLSHSLPLIPIIEGNQYSTVTAAKVFPEGGSEDRKIRDCRCFDTDLNVMLPRRIECTRTLGLSVEDASLGPGHLVLLCSMRDDDSDDDVSAYLKLCDDVGAGENDGDSVTIVDATAAGSDLPSLELQPGTTLNIGSGYIDESIDNSMKSGTSRRSSGSWMTKIKSSRNAKKDSSTTTLPGGGTLESEKKRSSNWRIFK
jgi:alpha-tubulin suppressor-like RCC1 family protein